MPTETTEMTGLHGVLASPAVKAAFQAILDELAQAQRAITEVRGPDPARAAAMAETLERFDAIKGRKSFFPYIGSGLGNGALVQLEDGSVKWDLINGIGVHMFGHGDRDLIATALAAALSDTVMQGNLQFNAETIEFAELLVKVASRGSQIANCFAINSGALANESALKVCFHHNAPATRVIAFEDCFAGRTMAMAQVGDSAAGRVGLPLDLAVDYLPFYDPLRPEASSAETLADLRKLVKRYPGQHACFAVELVQGEGGFNLAPREFFVPLLELCKEHSIGVWFDEVQTFGRLPEPFAFQHLDIGHYADVVSIGKISQVCACLYTAEYNPKPGLLSATFIGSTVGLAVGRRLIGRLLDGGYYGPAGRIAGLQEAFRDHANELVRKHPAWFPEVARPDGLTTDDVVGGIGGMMRMTPFGGEREPVTAAMHALYEAGIISFTCGHGPYHIRFLPPVGIMEPEQFADVFEIVERAFRAVACS